MQEQFKIKLLITNDSVGQLSTTWYALIFFLSLFDYYYGSNIVKIQTMMIWYKTEINTAVSSYLVLGRVSENSEISIIQCNVTSSVLYVTFLIFIKLNCIYDQRISFAFT